MGNDLATEHRNEMAARRNKLLERSRYFDYMGMEMNIAAMLRAISTTHRPQPSTTYHMQCFNEDKQAIADEKYRNVLIGKRLTAGEISTALKMSYGGMSKTLTKLVERGMVSKDKIVRPGKYRSKFVFTWIGD